MEYSGKLGAVAKLRPDGLLRTDKQAEREDRTIRGSKPRIARVAEKRGEMKLAEYVSR